MEPDQLARRKCIRRVPAFFQRSRKPTSRNYSFAESIPATQDSAHLYRPEGHRRVAFARQLLLCVLAAGTGPASRLHAARRLWQLPSILELTRRELASLSHAIRGSEDVFGRAFDEAGSDEHGVFYREPCAVSRPHARRIFYNHS